MNSIPFKSFFTLGLLAASLLPAVAEVPCAGMPGAGAARCADQILRKMSQTLAAAHTFSFQATRQIDVGLLGGLELPGKARIDVLVQRPNGLAAHSVSKTDERRFVADGRTLTVFDAKTNFYSVVPMRTTLDGLVDRLDEKYGFTPPLAEFALSDPYREFHREADSVSYLGRAKLGAGFLGLGGVECDRIALKGKDADAELWIGASDHLPRRLVATFKKRAARPQLRIDFLRWNLAAHATPADFTFTPPKGAMKIEMWTVEKMQAVGGR